MSCTKRSLPFGKIRPLGQENVTVSAEMPRTDWKHWDQWKPLNKPCEKKEIRPVLQKINIEPIKICKELLDRRAALGMLFSAFFSILLVFPGFLEHLFCATNPLACFNFYLSLLLLFFPSFHLSRIFCQLYCNPPIYDRTRFQWFMRVSKERMWLLLLHLVFGFIFAEYYVSFLPQEESSVIATCLWLSLHFDSRHIFLDFAGVAFAAFHFVKRFGIDSPPALDYKLALNYKPKEKKIYELIVNTLRKALIKSIVPTLIYAALFSFCKSALQETLLPNAHVGSFQEFISVNFCLLCYTWMLGTLLLSCLHIKQHLFAIVLTEHVELDFERSIQSLMVIYDPLAVSEVPIIRYLAALRLFSLSYECTARAMLYSLSKLDGKPHNWKGLFGGCLLQMQLFKSQLENEVNKYPGAKRLRLYGEKNPEYFADTGKQIVLREIHKSHGIIPGSKWNWNADKHVFKQQSPQCNKSSRDTHSDSIGKMHDRTARSSVEKTTARKLFTKMPPKRPQYSYPCMSSFIPKKDSRFRYIYDYWFRNSRKDEIEILFKNSMWILPVVHALTNFCECSLSEDHYGVVQDDVGDLILKMLELKIELDILTFSNIKKENWIHDFTKFHCEIKKCLNRLCQCFAPFLHQIVRDLNNYQRIDEYFNGRNSNRF